MPKPIPVTSIRPEIYPFDLNAGLPITSATSVHMGLSNLPSGYYQSICAYAPDIRMDGRNVCMRIMHPFQDHHDEDEARGGLKVIGDAMVNSAMFRFEIQIWDAYLRLTRRPGRIDAYDVVCDIKRDTGSQDGWQYGRITRTPMVML